jgi:uncharacterized membrane protein YcaP (DUF421 family)
MSIVIFRTIILYTIVVASLRMMGKRQLGEMSPSELVIAIVISELVAIPMQDLNSPLINGIIPILTLLSLEIMLSVFSLKSPRFRRILSGQPCILIERGKVMQQSLKRTRLTIQELTEELRQQGYSDFSTVQYAIIESNGRLSVLPFPAHAPATAQDLGVTPPEMGLPIPLISDGAVVPENLALRGVDRKWLDKRLKEQGLQLSDVFLLTADESKKLYWARKEAAS